MLALLMRYFPRVVVYTFALIPVFWYYAVRKEGRWSSVIYQEKLGLRWGPWQRFRFGLTQARAFSYTILDNMYLGMFGADQFVMTQQGTEVFHRAVAEGRGLILVSAHVGNWHLAVNFLSNVEVPVHLVIDDVRAEEVKRQMDQAKAKSAHLILHPSSTDPNVIFELKAALSRGEVVILAADRVRGERRVKLPFLGREAWFPTTAYALAAIAQAPICMALSFRTGMQRYECYGMIISQADPSTPPRSRTAEIEAMARTFVDFLEKFTRRFPTQWFNFYDFWA